MQRPTADQIAAASAILRAHTRQHGATASETMLANTVYSILAVLGGPGQPSQQFAHDISIATSGDIKIKPMITYNDDGSFTVTAENPLDLPIGAIFVPQDMPTDDGEEAPVNEWPDETAEDKDKKKKKDKKPKAEKHNLPNEPTLERMTKAQLMEVVKEENVDGVDDGNTNAEIVEAILESREET